MLFNLKRYLEETKISPQEDVAYKIATILLVILLLPFISIPIFVLFYFYVKNLQLKDAIIKGILIYITCGILYYSLIQYTRYNKSSITVKTN